MIKGMSKVTSLLVAAATVATLIPAAANAAEVKKISSEDGIIYNAVAYKNGISFIDGEVNDNDAAYYYVNGKYTELDDVDSGSDYSNYGSKYINVDDGDYFIDLDNGSVTDDSVADDDEDDAASALRKKIKSSDRYLDTVTDSTKTVFGDTDIADLTPIKGNKFTELWYETKIGEDISASGNISKSGLTAGSGATPYFTLYTDKKGSYIDADYNLGKIKVSTTGAGIINVNAVTTSAAVTIENTKDTYKLRNTSDTYAKITNSITLGQDSSNIYRYAQIKVITTPDSNGNVSINGRLFTATLDSVNGIYYVNLNVIQKISKAQDSDDIDDAKYAKTVTNYVISDEDGLVKSNSNEANYFSLSTDSETKATIVGSKLVLYKVTDSDSDDNVQVQAATLKSKNGYYYTDVEDNANITAEFSNDIDKTAFDTDVDGNLYVLDAGYIKKFDGTDDWDKLYKVDGSMDSLSVYDKDNMVAWSQDDEVFSIVGKKSSNDNTDTEIPTVTTGWVQSSDGTWSYFKADGTKSTGWLNDRGTWYYLKTNGVMATGWVNDNGIWYFLSPSGAMKTGWIYDNGTWYFLSSSGAMKTGWLNDSGTWYYLNSSGAMLANTIVDGYKLSANGALI